MGKMLLKSIKLNNIRSYLDEEINFPQGSVLLSGDIGAGKSTILLAIEFGLFGILRSELTGNSLLRNGKNSGFVELVFEAGEREIAIKRVLKRTKDGVKQDSGQIIINGSASDMTPQELKAKILEILGYPDELLTSAKSLVFRYTVYTPQEEMKKIIFDDGKERLNTLRRVFGVDKYKRIIENSEAAAKKISEEARILYERTADLEEKKSQKEILGRQIDIFREKIKGILCDLQKNDAVFSEKKRKIERLEKSFMEYNELKKDFSVLRTRLSEKESQERRFLSETEKLKKEIVQDEEKIRHAPEIYTENFEAFLAEDEKKYLSKLDEKAALGARKSEAESRIKSVKDEIEIFEKALKEAAEKKSKLESLKGFVSQKEMFERKTESLRISLEELRDAVSTKEALKKTAEDLKGNIIHLDKCPVCSQAIFLGQKRSIEREQEARAEKLKSEISALLAKKNETEAQIEEFGRNMKEILEKEKDIERTEGALSNSKFVEDTFRQKQRLFSELSERLQEFSKKLSGLSVNELEASISAKKEVMKRVKEAEFTKKEILSRNERLLEAEKNLRELSEEKARILRAEVDLVKTISEIGNCEQELSAARKDFEVFQDKFKKIEMEKLSAEKDIENSEKIMRTLSEEIEKKIAVKSRADRLKNRQGWLKEKLVPLAKLIESHIMQAVYEEFDSHFRNWVSVLIEDESISMRLDENFAPAAEQNGFQISVSDLSGGEKTSCALAYRLALNKVINDIMSAINTKNLLILDEPTDGFSSEQLDKVRDVLEQLGTEQTIIVSHEPKLESFVDNIIRITKSHHVSRVFA